MIFEFYEHKRKDRVRWAIAFILIILLTVFCVGLCLQLFMPDGNKVTDWAESIKSLFTEQRPLIEVGDEITYLYGNTEKTTEEVVAMLDSLDWSDAELHYSAYYELTLCTFETVVDSQGLTCQPRLYVYKSINGSAPYFINFDNGVHYHGSTGNRLWTQTDGWSTGPYYNEPKPLIVDAVYQQDLWKDFVSKISF